MSEGYPLNEALRQEALAVDGVTDVIENRQAVHVRFEIEESSSGGMCDLLSDRNRDQMEAALVSGTLPQDSHSIALDMEYAEDMYKLGEQYLAMGHKICSKTYFELAAAKGCPKAAA